MEIDTSFLNVGEAPDSITGAFIDQDILTFEPTTADTFKNPKLKDHIFRIEGEAYDKNDIEGTLVRNFNEQIKNGGSHIVSITMWNKFRLLKVE